MVRVVGTARGHGNSRGGGVGGWAEGRVFLSALLNCCFRNVGGLGGAFAGDGASGVEQVTP